jgi:asparagine synthase (glutamine-hydrolysing)
MCGIAGIINIVGNPIKIDRLVQMSAAQIVRGPDDEGFVLIDDSKKQYSYAGENSSDITKSKYPNINAGKSIDSVIGVAHQRFSILDVSEAGHQPWINNDNNTVLVFNGEIYNYIELRKELEELGFGPFTSKTDTEVVSFSYQAWGVDCFKKFNGFWAIAIIDLECSLAIFSRDRFGKKPLYVYSSNDGEVYFSSNIKAILTAFEDEQKKFEINEESIFLYLAYDRRNALTSSFWKDIKLLDPATTRVINLKDGNETEFKYWVLPNQRQSKSEIPFEQAMEKFRELFDDAVRIRMRSDVPIAVNLSGGMDSSAIVASAQKCLGTKEKLHTCVIRYNDAPELDESHYAQAVADFCGTNHEVLTVSSDDVWTCMDHLIDAFEEPVHSLAFMTQWLGWKATRDKGKKVILHGAAADEMLVGYSYLTDIADIQYLNKLEFSNFISGCRGKSLKKNLSIGKKILQGYVYPGLTNPIRKILGKTDRRFFNQYYNKGQFDKWLDIAFLEKSSLIHEKLNKKLLEADKSVEKRMYEDITMLRIPYWVNAMDKSMMDLPVEVRMPFLDYRVVEFLFSLPTDYLYDKGWTKYILRRSMETDLPDSITWRKNKMGFTVPKEKWLNTHKEHIQSTISKNRDFLESYVNLESIENSMHDVPSNLLWRIVNLAMWAEKHSKYT